MCLENRHFLFFVVFLYIFCVPVNQAAATDLNLINSQLLRMKDRYDPLEAINPLIFTVDKKTVGGNLDLNAEKDIYDFYKDISSKNQTQINQRLQQSFGSPYSFFGKSDLFVKADFENSYFMQTLHADMGGSFFLTDPVFPEVKTLLFQNYGASSELNYFSKNNYKINFSLNYGYTRLIQQNLNVGDLLESKPSFKLKEKPWRFYLSLGLDSEYNFFDLGNIIVKVNSVPIVKQEFELFNSFVGIMTTNVLPSDFKVIDHLKFYSGFSPFYKGDYSLQRTLVLGSNVGVTSWMNLDVFTTDNIYLGGQIKLGPEFFNASLYTYQESYDDYGIYTFRNYGFNLNFNF